MKRSELTQFIKEAITSKQVLKEEKSVDQLMSALGDAILADDNAAMKLAFKDLKSGLIGRIKNKLDPSSAEQPLNENISPELEKKVNTFIKSLAKFYDYSEADAISGIKQVLAKKNKK
jgi:hypothetical protein